MPGNSQGRLKECGLEVRVLPDEMHSAYKVSFREGTEGERNIDKELAAQPEYRRLRSLSKQIAAFNKPPFVVVTKDSREEVGDCVSLMERIKGIGTKGAAIQRYKGLGEMNAGQLWDTTMNPETRRLLEVRADDSVETDKIFTTLMWRKCGIAPQLYRRARLRCQEPRHLRRAGLFPAPWGSWLR